MVILEDYQVERPLQQQQGEATARLIQDAGNYGGQLSIQQGWSNHQRQQPRVRSNQPNNNGNRAVRPLLNGCWRSFTLHWIAHVSPSVMITVTGKTKVRYTRLECEFGIRERRWPAPMYICILGDELWSRGSGESVGKVCMDPLACSALLRRPAAWKGSGCVFLRTVIAPARRYT
jgi:hypothetical protein